MVSRRGPVERCKAASKGASTYSAESSNEDASTARDISRQVKEYGNEGVISEWEGTPWDERNYTRH
jgi:hypothetical protein